MLQKWLIYISFLICFLVILSLFSTNRSRAESYKKYDYAGFVLSDWLEILMSQS